MKKVFIVLMAGMFVASASAAQLDLLFAGGSKEITMAPGDKAVIDVHFSTSVVAPAPDGLSAIGFTLDSAVAPHLAYSGVAGATDGWANDSNAGTGLGYVNLSGPILTGPFDMIIGSIEIEMVGGQPEFPEHQCFVQIDLGQPAIPSKADGGDYSLLAMGSAYQGYAGYFAIGAGSPGYTDGFAGVSPADPLIINCVPEPASLALLALGGLALIRRR